MPYLTSHVTKLYDIVPETVRQWSMEFERYLSPTANPGKGKKRLFTIDDLRVFDLVASMKSDGYKYSDIHTSLANGQRGNAPNLNPDDLALAVNVEANEALQLQLETLQHRIVELQKQLKIAQSEVEKADELREENVRLQTSLQHTKDQLDATEQRYQGEVEKLNQERAQLYREIGKLSAQLDMLKGHDSS